MVRKLIDVVSVHGTECDTVPALVQTFILILAFIFSVFVSLVHVVTVVCVYVCVFCLAYGVPL